MYAALIGLFIWHSEYVVDLGGDGERVVPHFYIFVLHGLCCLECVIEFKERLFETWKHLLCLRLSYGPNGMLAIRL